MSDIENRKIVVRASHTVVDAIAARPVRASLHVELADALRTMILEGYFPADERIPERTLCDQFDVSRTPLREALKVLAVEGLIELSHNKGARLRATSRKEVADLFEVLCSYEATVGRLAAERASDAELAAIRAMHTALRAAYTARERTDYFKRNQDIHAAIVAMTKNDELKKAYRQCATKIAIVRYQVNYNDRRWKESMAEHETIMECLSKRNRANLSRVLRLHAEATAQSTIEQVERTVQSASGPHGAM
jgi:DNA-binding GntR family transcriptional regulator